MKISLVDLFFFLLTATTTVCQAQDCIQTLVDLERSILSNGENIQSLTDTFYPANKHPAVYVKVQYNIKGTNKNATFYWVSSPVFTYVRPKYLEFLSLKFVTLDLHVIDLVISPFCAESSPLPILTQATTWIKSYTTRRISAVTEGVDPAFQGYTLDISKKSGLWFIFIAGSLLGLFLPFVLTIYLFSENYTALYNKAKERPNHKGQNFKNKLWAGVVVLAISNVIILCMDLQNLSIPAILLHIFLLAISSLPCAMFLTLRHKAKPLNLPELMKCLSFSISKCCHICCQCRHGYWQFVFFLTLYNSSQLVSLHGCGLLLALLVDPLQVSIKAMFCILIIICAHIIFTYILEYYENNPHNMAKFCHLCGKCCHLRNTFFCAIFGLCFIGFLILVSIAYVNVIQFVTVSVRMHAVSSLTQIFPIVLIGFSGWLLKKQYENFIGGEEDNDQPDIESGSADYQDSCQVSVSNEDIHEDNNEQVIKQNQETAV